MIYTVTLNPAIDKTVQIDNLHTGEVNRVLKVRQDPGGKGINVSKVIASLGGESVAMGLLAGRSGQYIDEALQESGIATDFLYVEGETRTNLKIIDAVKGENTDINEPGPKVDAALLEKMKEKLEQTEMDLEVTRMNLGDARKECCRLERENDDLKVLVAASGILEWYRTAFEELAKGEE